MKKSIYLIVLVVLVMSCSKKQPADLIPKHESFTIESKYVNETRTITVWTPPSYKNTDTSFPVLYMPDGGINEDFPHIANTISKLIKNKSIPPIILVGIKNTIRGRDLTGFSEVEKDAKYCPIIDGAANFRSFITEELFIEISKKYRVSNKKGIIGESLADLFVIETLLLKPNSFDFYIAMDPSLWWNNHYLVSNSSALLKNFPDKKIKLWFAGSSAEDISLYTNQLEKEIKKTAQNGLLWKYANEPNEKHNTIFRATKEKALKWILN